MAVAVVINNLLPLAHHAEHLIVDDDNFDRDVVYSAHRQFLGAHLHAAVAVNRDDESDPGLPICAPIADGKPKPIVPSPPEVIQERGCLN